MNILKFQIRVLIRCDSEEARAIRLYPKKPGSERAREDYLTRCEISAYVHAQGSRPHSLSERSLRLSPLLQTAMRNQGQDK